MGIVVCICMLLGLAVLQPSPLNYSKRAHQHAPKFVLFVALTLLGLGLWNAIYGFFGLGGFWRWASLVSGVAMVLGSFYIFAERKPDSLNGRSEHGLLRKIVIVILVLSFLVYAVTLIQLNLGYPILR